MGRYFSESRYHLHIQLNGIEPGAISAQQNQEQIERQWAQRQQQQTRTNQTKDMLLVAKDRRIKALEEENRKLKEELKRAYGKLYEQV